MTSISRCNGMPLTANWLTAQLKEKHNQFVQNNN
jgi:hypothetical protein